LCLSALVLAPALVPAGAEAVLFSSITRYPAPSNTSVLAVHDFNSDGHPDVVTQDGDTALIHLFTGDGTGSLMEAPLGEFHAYGEMTDLNGDGIPDFVSVGFGGSPAGVYVQERVANGTGGFLAPTEQRVLSGNIAPGPSAIGNFTGAGKADLAFEGTPFGGATELFVAPATGNGSFGAVSWSHEEPKYARIFDAGDLNGDGYDDLAAEGEYSVEGVIQDELWLLLSDGHGGYGAPHKVGPVVASGDVLAGDLDHDGVPELVVPEANCIADYEPAVAGQLQLRGCYPTAFMPGQLALADFNGDGAIDVLYGPPTFMGQQVGVLFGEGEGGFGGGGETYDLFENFYDFKIGDLNGDGLPDLVIGNGANDLLVLLNTASGEGFALEEELLFPTELIGASSPNQSVTFENSGERPLTVTSVGVSPSGERDFSVGADDCPSATLQPGETCRLAVTFTPAAAGTRAATLVIASTAPNSPQTVGLTGEGATPAPPHPPKNPLNAAVSAVKLATLAHHVDSHGDLSLYVETPAGGTLAAVADARLAGAAAGRAHACKHHGCQLTHFRYGSASATDSSAGELHLVIKPSRKARAAFAAGTPLRITVSIVFRPYVGQPSTTTLSLTLRKRTHRHPGTRALVVRWSG
jgi:hypothetical protein